MANRLGHIAAAKAHGRLRVDPGVYPVNVNKAIDDADLSLMRRPLPRLFGIYVEAAGKRGVLVNSMMTRATRRHTAAHELGHHEFGHRPDPARRCAIESAGDSSPGAPVPVRARGEVEMTAEAFAAWFLMPRRAVIAALADLGQRKPTSAREVYQLSLMLGTTFRATCRHLANLRMVRQTDAEAWARTQPARLKRDAGLAAGLHLDSTLDIDVWDLRTRAAGRVEASLGDILVAPSDSSMIADQVAGMTVAAGNDQTVALACGAPQSLTSVTLGAAALEIVVHPRPTGLYLPDSDLSRGGVPLDDVEPA
ncbi:ImmA/IrrE family metallo-endopeptidase [Jiangella asiatica]|uniref:ImmA/IrrE family metallo-endopeptidase n=2 Tax=Jiangella asiatica TaxID=2530372 RepID=A0A4R5D9R3_9ACTN|nr:ImmA/IrrE family metallo-endopeptidase [Jiangella asiatica]